MRGYGNGAPKMRPAAKPREPESVVFKANEEPKEGTGTSAKESVSLASLVATAFPIAFPMPEDRRHQALLRMLGHVKDAIASRLDELPTRRDLYLAMALAGYNSSRSAKICNAEPGQKALWAKEDAEALLALGSEEEI